MVNRSGVREARLSLDGMHLWKEQLTERVFQLTEEQEMIRQVARDYAQRELIKDVIERDEKAIYPTEHMKQLAELGFTGMMKDLPPTDLANDLTRFVFPEPDSPAKIIKSFV